MSSAQTLKSTLFEYRVTSITPGIRDGTVTLTVPYRSRDKGQIKAIRLVKAVISKQIPNVYSYDNFDNTKLRVSNDGGVTWTIVNLTPGIYTVAYIQAAINAACASLTYWINNADPGFILDFNPATEQVYIKMDSTKLIGGIGQLGIDFGNSDMKNTLGFTMPTFFILDGLHTANINAQVDAQGTMIDVKIFNVADRIRYSSDGSTNNTLCVIPIDSTNPNEVIYQPPFSPLIPCSIPPVVAQFTVNFVNGLGRPLYLLTGNVLVEFEIINDI